MATISSLLRDHVTLQVRSVDRLFPQGYVPRLMTQGQLLRFLLDQGNPIPSPALLGKIGRAYVEQIDRFAVERDIPVVRFRKGDCKEELARPYLERAAAEGRSGVVMIGTAQEKSSAWRGWRDGGLDGHPHFEFARQTVFVNHYYFYVLDHEWGPAFIKTCAYAPFPVWVYLNGHEWANASHSSRPSLRGARQRLSLRRRRAGARSDHGPLLRARRRALLRPLAGAAALAVHGGRPPPRLSLRVRLAPARALKHEGL